MLDILLSVLLIFPVMIIGLAFSYLFWNIGKKELTFGEYLNKCGYAYGKIGLIIFLIVIALINTWL